MTAVGDRPGASGRGPLTAVSWLDWKLGARLLLKYPALTIIGGLSLAGAIAIGAVGIEVADELLYKRLPFPAGGRIVRLETEDAAASRVEPRVLHDFAIWRRSLKTVAELGAARVSERNVLTGEGRVESLRVAEITASAFPLTRVPPLLGRPLQPTDEMQGAEPVVLLGYDVWQRQFLHDPAIIGRVATVVFARTAMRESEIVVRHALGASRARVIAQIVTEALVLALAAAMLGLVVAQTTVRYAWARASQITGDDLPFWVDLTLEPATIAYALLLALVAAALIGLLPALKATGVSVQRGLQGITSTGGTMGFGGIWSFIIGAQVACTLLFVPAAVGIFTYTFYDQAKWVTV